MSQTHLATPAAMASSCDRAVLAGVALSSFAALLLELALTRLFSVVLFYHFAFLAVSVALLGLGAGGVCAYLRRDWMEQWTAGQLGTRLCLLKTRVIVAALWVVLHVPVSLGLDAHNFLRLTALYLACAVPFFFTGLLFAVVFAREASRVATLYGADLLGGAAACLAVVPALNWLGGPNAVLFAALVMAGASLVWARLGANHKGHEVRTKDTKDSEPRQQAISDMRWRRTAITAVGLNAVLIAANYSGLLFDVVYAKGWRQDLKLRLFAKWNSLSRVEVKQVGDSKYIVIDSDATTAIMNVDAHQWHDTAWEHNLMYAAPAVTNVLRPRGEYAIIGPGGGVDVLRAVANGSPRVVGIEINPIIANTIMRERFADYAYHLYEIPEVTIHVSDGRSWLRSSKAQFDVVQMTLVDTWASTAAGAFALSENNLYTRE